MFHHIYDCYTFYQIETFNKDQMKGTYQLISPNVLNNQHMIQTIVINPWSNKMELNDQYMYDLPNDKVLSILYQ